ncbi:MAG: hypothetical protein GY811_10530 [Myxococcales bacterium]|nr:hypothetical protein [Myxococcales bacterium]
MALSVLSLVASLGCSKPETAPAAEPSAPATEPSASATEPSASATEPAPSAAEPPALAPAPAAAPARTATVSLVPSSLAKTGTEGVSKYCLDCRVKKAQYEYCLFDVAQLTEVVGAENLDKEVTLNVGMTPAGSENYKPKDPGMSQPEGGFANSMFSCQVLGIEASK